MTSGSTILRALCLLCAVAAGCYRFDTAAAPPPAKPLVVPDVASSPVVRSSALFSAVATVFRHPRCANCHSGTEHPLQGRQGRLHAPRVAGARCELCHGAAYDPQTQIPGAPRWRLAPAAMGWVDRTDRQLCEQVKDPAANGGRTLAAVVEHLRHDELVAYGWSPGPRLEAAAGSQTELADLFSRWVKSGAHCP